MKIPAATFRTREYAFDQEITLEMFTVDVHLPHRINVENDRDRCGFFSCLSGNALLGAEDVVGIMRVGKGACGAYVEPKGLGVVAEYDTHEPFSMISITMPPATLMKRFRLDGNFLPEPFKAENTPPRNSAIHFLPPKQPLVRSLQALLDPPLADPFHHVFRECKVLETVALMLDALHAGRSGSACPLPLTSEERLRLHAIRDRIVGNLCDPPPLIELAHDFGFTHNKLNQGFRELFGCTVYEYLRDVRLEQAREMLLSGDYNVTEACLGVGYSNLSHFAKIYRSRFGQSPSVARRRLYPTARTATIQDTVEN